MSSSNKSKRLMPFIMAVCVVIGIFIGTFYASHFTTGRLSIINTGGNKLNNLLHIIDDKYVDTVDINNLVEDAMPQILSELDPHSVYISAKDVQSVNDDLKGSFSGVGIEFTIREDTIRVQNVINSGPADRAGVLAGDKIVTVDGEPFVGKVCTSDEAKRRLKGPKGTKVTLGLLGYGAKEIREVTVTRDDITQASVGATYMVNDNTGYIRIKSFGENTYPEMLIALARLSTSNLQNIIIDLRGNTGGYMMAVIQMVNEFLPKNRLIVYTEGRKSAKQEYFSDGRGSYESMPIVLLIDEASASASEIFAGAIQDNDRGTIIGRRSFGKGLVQQQLSFNDSSMVRLTVARYYSPSGRCIQKPYTSGSDKSYDDDLLERYEHGEYFSQDSIKHTGPEYHTVGGRTVYGGGGITPDIFIPEDTTGMTSYFKEAGTTGLILQYAYDYTDRNRTKLSGYSTMESLMKHLSRQNLVEDFAKYAEKRGLKRRNLMIKKSRKLLERYIISRIIYNTQGEDAWTKYLNLEDLEVKEAVKVFKEGRAFPTLSEETQ